MALVLLFVALIVIAVVVIAAVIMLSRKRKLSSSAAKRLHTLLDTAGRTGDPRLRIMEYDKILNLLLQELGFTGTTGEKLFAAGPRFSNKEALWHSHKIRNVLAHEHGAVADDREAERFRSALVEAIRQVS